MHYLLVDVGLKIFFKESVALDVLGNSPELQLDEAVAVVNLFFVVIIYEIKINEA